MAKKINTKVKIMVMTALTVYIYLFFFTADVNVDTCCIVQYACKETLFALLNLHLLQLMNFL